MSHEHDDPLLDSCLAELIGGQTPPDLSEQILAAWLRQRSIASAASLINGHRAQPSAPMQPAPLPPTAVPLPLVARTPMNAMQVGMDPVGHGTPPGVRPVAPAGSAPMAPTTVVQSAAAEKPSRATALVSADAYAASVRRRKRQMRWVGLAASVLVAMGLFAVAKNLPPRGNHDVAGANGDGLHASTDRQTPKPLTAEEREAQRRKIAAINKGVTEEEVAERERKAQERRAEKPEKSSAVATSQQPTEPIKVDENKAIPFTASPMEPKEETRPSRPSGGDALASSSSDADVIAYINEMIRQQWQAAGVSPSAAATDAEWIRRVFLDILGRIPTGEETMRYVGDKSKDKRARLVDRLLDSDNYIEEYARNWTTIWTNILIGRTGGTQRNTLVSREGLQQYLRRSFENNKSYDQMAFELISATGANKPGEPDYNGAVNFLLDNLNENATPATAKVARIFMGLQVQCTQCHNHPFNEWKQDQFWSLNAFLRQTRALRTREGGEVVSVSLVNQDFAGEGGNPKEAEVYYELRNGILKVAYPVFVDGTKIDPSGYIDQVNRRAKLAEFVRGSPYLSKAFVNRLWGHFLGYGFTKPVDDMGPHNAPSHPDLLNRLAGDFAGHGFDVRQLIRWITLSEAYSLSSKIGEKNNKDDPSMGERPLFSHFYLRQMRAEELYQSLIVATGAERTGGGDYAAQERRKSDWLRQFSIAFGTDEKDETTTFNGTIPQTLMMWNGELVNNAVSGQQGTFLQQVAATNAQPAVKLNQLFMTALARKPTKREVEIAQAAWIARKGDTLAALQDVWWVVLNTNEFILNH